MTTRLEALTSMSVALVRYRGDATNADETDMERCIRAAVRDCAVACRATDEEVMEARKELYNRYLKAFEGA